MTLVTYRVPAPSATEALCSLCQVATGEPACAGCASVLQVERWNGIGLGLRASFLLAFVCIPAMLFGPGLGPAMAAWLLAPLAWILIFRKKPGARAEARAMGIALGHILAIVLTAAVVTGGMTLIGAGPPF